MRGKLLVSCWFALAVLPAIAAPEAPAQSPAQSPATVYRGKPISIDVKDADIRDVLRFLADFGKADLVLDESVQGRLTIKLTNVPWDQVMAIVLKQLGYGFEIIGKEYRGDGITVVPSGKSPASMQSDKTTTGKTGRNPAAS